MLDNKLFACLSAQYIRKATHIIIIYLLRKTQTAGKLRLPFVLFVNIRFAPLLTCKQKTVFFVNFALDHGFAE